jgi:putative resolvase
LAQLECHDRQPSHGCQWLELAKLLADPTATTLVVEHRDRLARFGAEHLEAALSAGAGGSSWSSLASWPDDLVRDMTEVLTSSCARLYGHRGARDRAEEALRAAPGRRSRHS